MKALARGLSKFGAIARRDIDAAAGFGDADTADVFTQVSRAIDQHLWFVEATWSARPTDPGPAGPQTVRIG
jgi:starvation-inducible DNA-binding protein